MVDYFLKSSDYLPKNLKETAVMKMVTELIDSLMTSDAPNIGQIKSAYFDTVYKISNYSKLTKQAKLEILSELGFDYITNILDLDDEQLTNLLILFNLIYCLKGKDEGLKLILDIMKLNYTYENWYETSPKGVPLTATLTIIMIDALPPNFIRNVLKFVRSYMLVYIDIIVQVASDFPYLYASINSPGWGRIRIRDGFFAPARDPREFAAYDADSYYDDGSKFS